MIAVGDRWIGPDAACYVIAEVGVNHDGRLDLAHQLIDVAAAGGADAVKFQTFDPALLVAQHASAAPYQVATTGHRTQRQVLDGLTLPETAWAELRDHAVGQGMHFLSTAFDVASAHLLAELGVPAVKVPSGELTNTPFIEELAGLGLPVLVSTGMGDIDEVAAAVAACDRAPGVALFHCVSAYPAPETDANLRAITTLHGDFGVPVGWSDHTRGPLTAIAAVALGANLLEKHITLDRTRSGPDHAASEDPDGLRAYVEAVRVTEAALGDGVKRPQPSELPNRDTARRSWHTTRAVAAGETIAAGDVVALRPAAGLPPSTPVIGRRANRSLAAGVAVGPDDVERDAGSP